MSNTAARSSSIRRRLLLWLIPPLLLLLALSVAIDYRFAHDPAHEAYDQALLDSALVLAAHLHDDNGSPRLNLPPEAESAVRVDGPDQEYFALFDHTGRRFAGDAVLSWVPPTGSGNYFFDGAVAGFPIRGVVYRAGSGGNPVYIEVAETTQRRQRTANRLLAALVWPNLLMILATAALIAVGVRGALSPLLRVRDEVALRSPHDLKPLSTGPVPSEVRPLIDSLNRLFGLLAEQAEAQQRFLANAAHQLKTPLAALQTQLELAGMDENPASIRGRVAYIAKLTERVAHLAHQLLALARSEPGASLTAQMHDVELRSLAEQIASSHLDASLARGIDLGFDLAPAHVAGVPWLLHELLANLVDNALCYTPRGGSVTVRCGVDGTTPFLEVEDDGPGIPPNERSRIFERFYRSPGTTGDGCGLGLAIVREIAELHMARINVEDAASGRGTRFRIVFGGAVS